MTADETWLAAVWPFVRDNLPAAPARVIEIGCGPLGGFVPRLQRGGYDATGIDPEAPDGAEYRRVEFERDDTTGSADAIVACTSLHHVADLGEVLAKARTLLEPAGLLQRTSLRFAGPTRGLRPQAQLLAVSSTISASVGAWGRPPRLTR